MRIDRGWTQAELARRLELSQARLSQVERGDGSFTAEQLLVILRLFNVPASHFSFQRPEKNEDAVLQNALARLGARNLRESEDVLPSDKVEEVGRVLLQSLLADSPRLITAAAPVLVRNIDRVNLKKLQAVLWELGADRRLSWLVDSTLEALRRELPETSKEWALIYRRAEVILQAFLASNPLGRSASSDPFDFLDRGVRSKASQDATIATSSPIAQRWGIVTRIQTEDFAEVLRAARE